MSKSSSPFDDDDIPETAEGIVERWPDRVDELAQRDDKMGAIMRGIKQAAGDQE